MISATAASAIDGSSGRIASATAIGRAISSGVIPPSLFATNRNYPWIHVQGTGNCALGWTSL